ncbi:uncharacterized protein [Paramisgurnus dabryanus]|uniref:uncharacterized protein n=1 Tax=Paramisgurnus dabryanus TaxID=90735 RepID=UPI003CCF29D7
MDMAISCLQHCGKNLIYSRKELLELRPRVHAGIFHAIPEELKRQHRGCRAGVKVRIRRMEKRWRFKPPVPSCVMGNVNSLANKMDEMAALVKNVKLYRECSLICLTETWLTSNIPDASVELTGFSIVRADRDPKRSGKNKGGGLALFVNTRWCNTGHVTVKEIICCPDIELLAVSLRPYYMPRELSHAIVVCVYIPPRALADNACEAIHSVVARLLARHPEAFIAITGDFNHVTLDSTLSAFYQFVNCPTRKNRTIDLMYANVKDAYTASPLPPLGRSDHNLVFLRPLYIPIVRRQPTTIRSFRKWSPEAEATLRDCFESTDWNVLQEPYGDDIEGVTNCTTDYVNFCLDNVVPTRSVRCFPNNKPWITCDVKDLLNEKKRAFKEGDHMKLRSVQGELKRKLKEAKEEYKKKVEQKLQENNMKEVWQGMKIITGCKKKSGVVEGDEVRANQLNQFYNRFDCPSPAAMSCPTNISHALPISACPQHAHSPFHASATAYSPQPVSTDAPLPPIVNKGTQPLPFITAYQVKRELSRLRPGKAAGPDRVCPRLLKACAAELAVPLQHVFNLSLRLGKVPALWKTSCLIPVPKKPFPSELNDFRPVALTSHIMKTMERLLLHILQPQVSQSLDRLQFAYQEKIGVEDAIIYLLHRAYSHLDKGKSAVRILFFDFSSAFNTIQPVRLRDKLVQMGVDAHLVSWITDYLTERPQFVRLNDCFSETVISSTGAPQGTVLSPFLFTLYTSDFSYVSESCHMQKFSDDTVIMGCIRDGQEDEYRNLINDFVQWCRLNHLQLNATKTKELVVDFRRSKPCMLPVSIQGVNVEVVSTYKYLGVHLDNKLDWSANTDALYRRGQSRLYFLRRLRSFNICSKLLRMFYQSVISSVMFYAVVCWGGSIKKKDAKRLNRLVQKAGAVVGIQLESLTAIAEKRSSRRMFAIMDNDRHPLHSTFMKQRSMFSGRLLSLTCSTERLRRSFVPRAIQHFNATQGGRGEMDS